MNYFYPSADVRSHGRDADQATLHTIWNDVKDWGKNFLFYMHVSFLILYRCRRVSATSYLAMVSHSIGGNGIQPFRA
jgi:hypothetical protein